MKRFFILASAAIVALASCAKTEVVYKDAPEEIALKAYTGVMTKAPHEGTSMPTSSSMMVYASQSTTEDGTYTPYFSAKPFTYGTTWTGSQYWPESGYLKFLAYYPSTLGTQTGDAVNGVTLTVTDINQTDLLYSNLTNAQKCDTKPTAALTFNHALAQIQVKLAVADGKMANVTVNSVAITTPNIGGVFSFGASSAEWTSKTPAGANLVMNKSLSANLETTAAAFGEGALVVPGAQTSLVIDYAVAGLSKQETVELSTYGNWDAGKKYVYNVTISLDEIQLTASVADWDEDTKNNDDVADEYPVTIS